MPQPPVRYHGHVTPSHTPSRYLAARGTARALFSAARNGYRAYSQSQSSARSRSRRPSSATSSRRSSLMSTGSAISSVSGVSSRKASIRVKGAKKVAFKANKRVKVSKTFRKKVKEVMSDKKAFESGYYVQNLIDVIQPDVDQGQKVQTIPSAQFGGLFSPNMVLNAAGRLWCNKAPNFTPNPTDTGFSYQKFTVDVKKQWTTYRLRNNTQRTVTVDMYVCAPKNVLALSANQNPKDDWDGCIVEMTSAGINVGTLTSRTLYSKPTQIAAWNKMWKAEVVTFVLEPGNSVEHNVEGPRQTYNYEKFWQDTTFVNGQKFNRYVMFSSYTDLVMNTDVALTNRAYRSGITDTKYNVIVEATSHFELDCPEQVGFEVGSGIANGQQTLGNRMRRVAYDFQQSTPVHASIVRTDEENPALVVPEN